MPTMCQLKTISKSANPDADYFFALCWVTAVKCKAPARRFVCIQLRLCASPPEILPVVKDPEAGISSR